MGAVLLDQLRAFSKPGNVFGSVSRRLGDVVIEVQEHFIAHLFFIINFRPPEDRFPDEGVCILSLPEVFEIPGLMIDAGAPVAHLLHRRPDPAGQHFSGPLHAVAEARDARFRFLLHGPAEHGHGIGVVEDDGPGADPLDIGQYIEHDRYRAKGPEDSRGPTGVADVDVDPVFFWNFNVEAPNADAAREYGDEDAVGSFKRFRAVQGRRDFRRIAPGLENLQHSPSRGVEPLGINVHEGDVAVPEGGKRQDVADQPSCELEAPRADECHLLHGVDSSPSSSAARSAAFSRGAGFSTSCSTPAGRTLGPAGRQW